MMLEGFRLVDADEISAAMAPLAEALPDVLEACQAGTGLCFAGEYGMFAISLCPGENPGTLEAFVLAAIAARHGAFEAAESSVLQLARDLGAATVAFRSVRRGWARRLGPAWKPRPPNEFVREVR